VTRNSERNGSPHLLLAMLLAGFTVLALTCFAAGGWMVVARFGSGWADLGKGLLALGAAFSVGGVGTALLQELNRLRDAAAEKERKENESQAVWSGMLTEVVGVDHAVQVARQLIWAHKTVATYRDQYQVLVASRLRLRRMRHDPLVVNDDRQTKERDGNKTVRDHLTGMQRYLDDLCAEYEARYLAAARQQRIDEVFLTGRCAAIANREADAEYPPPPPNPPAQQQSTPVGDPVYLPTTAWEKLMEFPRLSKWLGPSFDWNQSEFVQSLLALKPMLEERSGIETRRGRLPADTLPTIDAATTASDT